MTRLAELKKEPCPICGHKDRCKGNPSRDVIACFRRDDEQVGEYHRKKKTGECSTFIRNGSNATAPIAETLGDFAYELHVSLDAVHALGVTRDGDLWAFPEKDATGKVIGMNRRMPEGSESRYMVRKGDKRGLCYPADILSRPGPILIPEGPSCAAAALAMGLNVVGRPSAKVGASLLADLLQTRAADCIVVGENDQKPNGDWPGKDGAEHVARELSKLWGVPVRYAFPPADCKDVRDFHIKRRLLTPLEQGRELMEHLKANLVTTASEAENTKPDIQIRSIAEMVAEYPRLRDPVIDGLLRQGESMNVIAPSKSGKSWMVNHLSLAIATGTPWLGFPTARGDVLILDNELHPATLANRIPKVAEAMTLTSDYGKHVYAASLRGCLRDIFTIRPFFDSIEPGTYRAIVLDAWYRFIPNGESENDNALIAQAYNQIDAYADRLGCSFILIHHTSKGSQGNKAVTDVGAGAGSQSRAADTHLILRPHEEPGAVVLDAAVRSFPPVEPRCLTWDFPLWHQADHLDPAAIKRETRRAKQEPERESTPEWTPEAFAAAFLKETPQSTATLRAAVRHVEGITYRGLDDLLRRTMEAGLCNRTKDTRYGGYLYSSV